MDNIKFTKIWRDTDFYQAEILIETNNIRNTIITYIVRQEIKELSRKINDFLSKPKDEDYWEIGERDSKSCPYLKFEFLSIDCYGHVKIDIYMDILSEQETEKYQCCFPIETEVGLLYNFANSIKKLNDADVNFNVQLFET